jgi:hypothetical protein
MDILDNKYIHTVLIIFVILYASKIGPSLPVFIRNLFNNAIFRVAILFLVVVRANKDPVMSLLIAVGFVLTLNYLAEREIKETFGEMAINSNVIVAEEETNNDESEQTNEPDQTNNEPDQVETGVMTCGL